MMPFADQVERVVSRCLARFGYEVSRTGHKASFDLVVSSGRRSIRVEVKGAQAYRHHHRATRYQANIRNGNFHLLIFVCFDRDHFYFFVIPRTALARRRSVSIWSRDPASYKGRWARYYGAWQYLDWAFEQAAAMPQQLPLV